MLKKIPVSRLRLGMHLHALEGPWIDHPFWKTKFVLTDPHDLKRLRESGVQECWIDTAAGLDVAEPDTGVRPLQSAEGGTATAHAAPTAATAARAPAALPQTSHSLDDELEHATAVCKRGRQAVMQMFGEARLGKAVDATQCLPLVDEISSSVFRNPGALVSLARLKTRDDYTYMHSVAVCALMVALGRQLGLDDDTCRQAGLAGMMHDLGKALMPLEVLNKPGKLTDEEFAVMRTHPERGHALLVEGGGAGEAVLDVALHHHEKFDGSGYPHKLAGAQISQLARMGAVCDVYDAITSNRPYKSGWDPAESIARMASWKGHFDGEIFHAFVRSLGIYPTGSIVRLRSQQLAIVVEQCPESLVTPVVKVFFSLKSNMPVAPRRVELARSTAGDRIIGREPPEAWAHLNLDELWAGEAAARRGR
jgi:HD-GYP domain-containing protein (c-di-GMP phosphodiesterase class II)